MAGDMGDAVQVICVFYANRYRPCCFRLTVAMWFVARVFELPRRGSAVAARCRRIGLPMGYCRTDFYGDSLGNEMKIAIVGTGAMGSVYAARFGKAGHEVWAIDTWQEHLDAIATAGLTVSGASGIYVVDNLHVGRSPHDAGPCDLWIIATKAAAVEEVAAEIAPLLRPDSVVMALQNGLGAGERVATHIPKEYVVIGIAEGFGLVNPATGPRPS